MNSSRGHYNRGSLRSFRAASYDATLAYGAQTPFSDQLSFEWMGSLWEYDARHDTLLSILNTDTQDARVNISLDYYTQDGVAGSYVLPERTLAAGAASTVDIGEVIASGQPDANGNAFPPGVTFGGYHVRKVGLHLDKTITTESLVFDRRSRTFTTFYNTCCGMAGAPTFSPDQFLGPVGPMGNFLNQGRDYCSGQTVDMTGSSTFSSSNTAIATVGTPGNVTGVATGSTNSNSFLSYFQQRTVDTCVRKTASAAEPTNVVSVTIGAVTPDPIAVGASGSVPVNVNPATNILLKINSSGTGAATFPGGTTTTNITQSTTVTLLGVTASQAAGDLSLTATLPDLGAALATANFTVSSGTCDATFTGSGGDGIKTCPSQVSVYNQFNISNYCPTCTASCVPAGYDSSFTPGICDSVYTGVVGALTVVMTSTANGTFASGDCNEHVFHINTTVVNAKGVKTLYQGGTIGLQCNCP